MTGKFTVPVSAKNALSLWPEYPFLVWKGPHMQETAALQHNKKESSCEGGCGTVAAVGVPKCACALHEASMGVQLPMPQARLPQSDPQSREEQSVLLLLRTHGVFVRALMRSIG